MPIWRQVCFGAGLVVIAGSLIGPVDDEADKLLWVHMIQHLLLADVASLFIVLGFTGAQAFQVLARASSHTNRKVADIAEELTTTGDLPGLAHDQRRTS